MAHFWQVFFPAVFTISAAIQGGKWIYHHFPKLPPDPGPLPKVPDYHSLGIIPTITFPARRTIHPESLILITTVSAIILGGIANYVSQRRNSNPGH